MSGFEIAGLMLAVIPTIKIAFDAYESACNTIMAIRNNAREVRKLQATLSMERVNFETYCHVLLSQLRTTEAGNWDSSPKDKLQKIFLDDDLNKRAEMLLATNKEKFLDIGRRTKDLLFLIETAIKDSGVIANNNPFQRARSAFASFLRERKIVERLKELHQNNENLQSIVGNIRALGDSVDDQARKRPSQPPRSLGRIRTASQDLFDSLKKSWSCRNRQHQSHEVRLCVDTIVEEHEGKIEFNVAIVSSSREGHCSKAGIEEFSNSIELLKVESSLPKVVQGRLAYASRLWSANEGTSALSLYEDTESYIPLRERKEADSARDEYRTELIQPSHPSEMTSAITAQILNPKTELAVNLMKTDDVCSFFKNDPPRSALGYLGSPSHSYHLLSVGGIYSMRKMVDHGYEYSLDQLFVHGTQFSFPVDAKLMLAEKLTKAVLQYHSTSWMHSHWSISDIGLFGVRGSVTKDVIQTLHLKSFISPDQSIEVRASNENHVEQRTELEYGVYQPTLFRLGVAFLEVEYGRCLDELRRDDDKTLIHTARRLACSTRVILSDRYRQLIDRCLRCDFGAGTDLNTPRLQAAVYWEVACELKQMYMRL